MTPLMADQPTGSGDSGRRSGDKARLSPKRRRRSVENDEYGEFIRRILRAYSRRVADGDVEALSLMTGLADELNDAIAQAVKGLRVQGYSLDRDRRSARHHPPGRAATMGRTVADLHAAPMAVQLACN
jgi:hypothetical protein